MAVFRAESIFIYLEIRFSNISGWQTHWFTPHYHSLQSVQSRDVCHGRCLSVARKRTAVECDKWQENWRQTFKFQIHKSAGDRISAGAVARVIKSFKRRESLLVGYNYLVQSGFPDKLQMQLIMTYIYSSRVNKHIKWQEG